MITADFESKFSSKQENTCQMCGNKSFNTKKRLKKYKLCTICANLIKLEH